MAAVLGATFDSRRREKLVALILTYPFETSTALAAAATLTRWSGEVDSAAAAAATVINCGVLEVERRVLGLDAKVGKEQGKKRFQAQ